MRYSRQRELILAALKAVRNHPTAEDIYHSVAAVEPNISLGTVYRNLNQLADAGEILRIPSANEKDRFDGYPDPHFHFHCSCCGRVYDLPETVNPAVDGFLNALSAQIGTVGGPERILLEGKCTACMKGNN